VRGECCLLCSSAAGAASVVATALQLHMLLPAAAEPNGLIDMYLTAPTSCVPPRCCCLLAGLDMWAWLRSSEQRQLAAAAQPLVNLRETTGDNIYKLWRLQPADK